MIKFFRKVRQRLLNENKFSKYLIYAFGEIILVIIGILIALNLNQRSEQRKVEVKIEAIFEDVLEELANNIENTNNLAQFYLIKDTIFNLVLNDKLTYNDYANPKMRGLFATTTTYHRVILRKHSYDNLVLYMDAISNKYKDIVNELNILNNDTREMVYDFNEVTMNLAANNVLEQSEKFEWFSFQDKLKNNEGLINYMLTNYTFKNKVKMFENAGIDNHLYYTLAYRRRAVNIYQKLAKLLDKPISNKSFAVDSVAVKPFMGTFSSEQAPSIIFTFYLKDDRFYVTSSADSFPREIIFMSKSKLLYLNNQRFATVGGDDEKFWLRFDRQPKDSKMTFIRIKDSTSHK